MDLLSSNLKLNFLKKKTSNKADEDLDGQYTRARQKWERLTHYMLNIDGMQFLEEFPEGADFTQIQKDELQLVLSKFSLSNSLV
jgi:hypothetical protein